MVQNISNMFQGQIAEIQPEWFLYYTTIFYLKGNSLEERW